MLFTALHGHLMDFQFVPGYDWNQCSPIALFSAPVEKKIKQGQSQLANMLKQEASKADWLILWTDCDREGENIAEEVAQLCSASNRRLQIYRARFSAVTRRYNI